ncbi:MAG: NAD(P)/FAD-dependent oxidoreductase, partial [Verrucomicrobiota bacterium]
GASAIQFVPRLAKEVKSLRVFQRSPNWIMRKRDREIRGRERSLLERIPLARRLYRFATFLIFESRLAVFYRASPAGWALKKYLSRYRRRRVRGEELAEQLTPDFPVGCKRILLSSDWFKTLQLPQVSVDSTGAERLRENAVVGGAGESFDTDVVIYATGFESTNFLAPIQIEGRGGVDLRRGWNHGAEAYLGMTVAGFPNFFVLYGPNTNLGHNSIVIMLEAQARYIGRLLAKMKHKGLKTVEVKEDVQERFNKRIQKQAGKTVWISNCENWYTNAEGKLVNNWPYSTGRYLLETRVPREKNFRFQE